MKRLGFIKTIGWIFAIILIILIGIVIYRSIVLENFDNMTADAADNNAIDASSEPQVTLDNNSDYQTFYSWNTDFCETWDKVIDHLMKIDQTTISKEEYIVSLESKNNTKFSRCSSIITKSPDPFKLLPVIPDNAQTYSITLDYMAQQISKIKQDTESIFSSNPTLRKLTNNITDIDGRAHELMGGKLIEKLQHHCVNNMTKQELASLFDHENGVSHYEFHPSTHKLIKKRIHELHHKEKM
jgi:hypothetical protein